SPSSGSSGRAARDAVPRTPQQTHRRPRHVSYAPRRAMAIDFEPHLTHDGLDWFVSWCLFEGDVWESPRTSDGVPSFEVERETDAWRVRGRIWAIEQTVHA